MKLILFLFLCLEIVLATVQRSQLQTAPASIKLGSDHKTVLWVPYQDTTPKEPADRYAVMPERFPQRAI